MMRWLRKWLFGCAHSWGIVGGFDTAVATHDVFECRKCGRRETVPRIIIHRQ